MLSNVARGDTYGFELAATYKVTPAWQLRAAYSFLIMDLQPLSETNQPEIGKAKARTTRSICNRPSTSAGTGNWT